MGNPENFFITYFLYTTAIAGLAVLWRNWLADHPNWKSLIERKLGTKSKVLTCGSCFTFWLALVVIIILKPLNQNLHIIIQWFSVGFSSVFLRFLYVLIQEKVSKLVHEGKHHQH